MVDERSADKGHLRSAIPRQQLSHFIEHNHINVIKGPFWLVTFALNPALTASLTKPLRDEHGAARALIGATDIEI